MNSELCLSEVLLAAERGKYEWEIEVGRRWEGKQSPELTMANRSVPLPMPLPSLGHSAAQEDLWHRFGKYVCIQAWGGEEIRRQGERTADLAWEPD